MKKSNNKLLILTTVLGIVLVILLSVVTVDLVRGREIHRGTDVSTLAWYLGRGNYSQISFIVKNEKRLNVKNPNPAEYEEFKGIGEYYYNAFRYYAMEKYNSESAQRYLARMNEGASKMGEYSFSKDEIDNLFISLRDKK